VKKNLFIIVMAISFVLAACGGDSDGGEKNIKLAHTGAEDHQYHLGAEKFKEELEDNSDTNFTVDIQPNASLGSEGEAVEQVSEGSVEMTVVAPDSNLANTIPEMNLFGIPYIFEDKEHVYNALDNEPGQELLDLAEDKGMKGLGYWEVGFRHLTNDDKEITNPEDVQGLKIRVQPAKVWEDHMNALGASPTPVDFDELYSALDQGVVDGEENPLPTINSMKFYEVQDYVSLTGHAYSPAVVLMSDSFYEGLSEEETKAVEDAVEEATTYQRETLDEQEDEIIEKLEDEGVQITDEDEVDRDAFQEATSEVRESVSDEVPEELVQKFIDAKE